MLHLGFNFNKEECMKILLAWIAAVLISGCSAVKTLTPIDGSKADAVITMGYTYGTCMK
jgi:uncharacterized protein YceK